MELKVKSATWKMIALSLLFISSDFYSSPVVPVPDRAVSVRDTDWDFPVSVSAHALPFRNPYRWKSVHFSASYKDVKYSPIATYDWSFLTEENGYLGKTEYDYLGIKGLPDHAILKGMVKI